MVGRDLPKVEIGVRFSVLAQFVPKNHKDVVFWYCKHNSPIPSSGMGRTYKQGQSKIFMV